MYNILFVCMGNICRSPSAEGFFCHHLKNSSISAEVSTDSVGTHSYHIGHAPDSRAIKEAELFGVDISGLRARKISIEDFEHFDLILAMDRHNLSLIEQLKPSHSRAKLALMMEYAPTEGREEVPDPYYGSQADFTLMCNLLDLATRNLLHRLESELA
jgi:protein-tyrosine phosphatase